MWCCSDLTYNPFNGVIAWGSVGNQINTMFQDNAAIQDNAVIQDNAMLDEKKNSACPGNSSRAG